MELIALNVLMLYLVPFVLLVLQGLTVILVLRATQVALVILVRMIIIILVLNALLAARLTLIVLNAQLQIFALFALSVSPGTYVTLVIWATQVPSAMYA